MSQTSPLPGEDSQAGSSPASSDDVEPTEPPGQWHSSRNRVLIGWTVALVVIIILTVVAIWQVDQRVYTAEYTAKHYWEAAEEGRSGQAIDAVASQPDFLTGESVDSVLLHDDALSYSASLIDNADIASEGDEVTMDFSVDGEDHHTTLPMTRTGLIWGFFDEWKVSESALQWFDVEVPGAPQGGIGQVQANGVPVNLDEETAQLAALIPTAAEFTVDSQWLVGSVEHVVTDDGNGSDAQQDGEQITLDLEASEDAEELLHAEVDDFFTECAQQQVLMPSGCPVGTSTLHHVDPDSIKWDFPDPESMQLTFDADGWHIDYEPLVAEVHFHALHYHSGEQLEETEEVPFDVDIDIGASGDDLIISVSGD